MASKKSSLIVVITATATRDLNAIWLWNAEHYSAEHADNYVAFLKAAIYALSSRHKGGITVSTRPELRYIQIQRRPKRHGHVVVFNVEKKIVNVLHIFHTAQDWQNKL